MCVPANIRPCSAPNFAGRTPSKKFALVPGDHANRQCVPPSSPSSLSSKFVPFRTTPLQLLRPGCFLKIANVTRISVNRNRLGVGVLWKSGPSLALPLERKEEKWMSRPRQSHPRERNGGVTCWHRYAESAFHTEHFSLNHTYKGKVQYD